MGFSMTLIALAFSLAYSEVLYMPDSRNIRWVKARPSVLKCPRKFTYEPSDTTNETDIEVQIPLLRNAHQPGHFCHKTKWVTTCSEGFFGSRTITHAVRHQRVSSAECAVAVKELTSGLAPVPAFPPENCGWLATNTEEQSFVVATPHEVKVDPYNLQFLDKQFLGGVCKGKFCETITDSLMWYSENGALASCPSKKTTLRVYPESTGRWGKFSTVWSDSFVRTNFVDACKIHVCYKDGVRFKHGSAFMYGDNIDSAVKKLIDSHPNCEADQGIIFQDVHTEESMAILNMADSLAVLECIDAVDIAKATGSITQMTLNHMMPDHARIGPGYRLNNGYLEMATVNYIPITVHPRSYSEEVLGTDEEVNNYAWSDWVPSGVKGVESGINGLVKVDGKIHLPWMTIKYQLAEATFDQVMEAQIVHHPAIEYVSNTQNLTDEQLDQHYNGGDLIETVTHMFGTLGQTIGAWIGIFALFVVVVLILVAAICCCAKCSCKRSAPVRPVMYRAPDPLMGDEEGMIKLNPWASV
ncbi:glycoprotein [Scophthalmus maximus rhabdovirus]|uniref:Glycoprotein n=1 Tax=Scophthalmus maximus rhabdovirus TaxID=936149 RepID=E7D0U5_9RHAB|nr:glycoprotein [Scophthalmus maximus rhabdovirus]ADU05405.1 glycoprotein [Scophthalmus maximus rhabdovirus]